MKMNRLSVSDADTARVCFNGQIRGKKYEITILMVEDLASVTVKRDGVRVCSETVPSIDDMKIFLEERLYQIYGSLVAVNN